MQQTQRGILIAIEGIDGSGKSTLAKNLAAKLQELNMPVVLTKEPGDTQLGALLRTVLQKQDVPVCPQAEFLLFTADRAQHFKDLIVPQLALGVIIISDRMADSSLAYQGYGRGLDIDMIKRVNTWVMNGITPDITLYVRIAPDIAATRLKSRAELTAFESQQTFMKNVLAGFEELYKDRKDVIILDGTKTPETLTQQALDIVLSWNPK